MQTRCSLTGRLNMQLGLCIGRPRKKAVAEISAGGNSFQAPSPIRFPSDESEASPSEPLPRMDAYERNLRLRLRGPSALLRVVKAPPLARDGCHGSARFGPGPSFGDNHGKSDGKPWLDLRDTKMGNSSTS